MTDKIKNNSLSSRKLIIAAILTLCIGGGIGLVIPNLFLSYQAKQQALATGKQLEQQIEIVAYPLILSNDRVSLNYLANNLTKFIYVQGIQIENQQRIIIAKAGNISSLEYKTSIIHQEKNMGVIRIWLNQAVFENQIKQSIFPLIIIILITIIPSLILLVIVYRHILTTDKNQLIEETEQPETKYKRIEDKEDSVYVKEDNLQTESLIDLLTLSKNDEVPHIPKFDPSLAMPNNEVKKPVIVEEQPSTLFERDLKQERENPLAKQIAEYEEVQLDLYPFEHELELMLPAQDAAYILYIDSNTASSNNITGEDRKKLLNIYLLLAREVAHIYDAATENLANKDSLLRFELHDDKDSHGINAIYAAMLFNLLYKGFNQARIKGFQPVLNLQMALARGHREKYDLLKEEAHFLTRTLSSNNLISHTALTEAPILKADVLKNSDIQREDEDKVLLLKLATKHQALLQKQANYLLTKFFKQ